MCLKIDIEECSTNTHGCNAKAKCSNTQGSYTCACQAGYSGDGRSCSGRLLLLLLLLLFLNCHLTESVKSLSVVHFTGKCSPE